MQLTETAQNDWKKNMSAMRDIFTKLTADIKSFVKKYPEHSKCNGVDLEMLFVPPVISNRFDMNDFASAMTFSAYLNGMFTFANVEGDTKSKHIEELLTLIINTTLFAASYMSVLSIIATVGKSPNELGSEDLKILGINEESCTCLGLDTPDNKKSGDPIKSVL